MDGSLKHATAIFGQTHAGLVIRNSVGLSVIKSDKRESGK